MRYESNYNDFARNIEDFGRSPYFPVIGSASDRLVTLFDAGLHTTDGQRDVVNFASCDYLGLSNDERVKEAAIDGIRKFGTNISGSMMLSGYTQYHRDLEVTIAEWFDGYEALVFPTSFLANLRHCWRDIKGDTSWSSVMEYSRPMGMLPL